MNLNNIFLLLLSVANGGALSSIRLNTKYKIQRKFNEKEISLHTLSFSLNFLCILYLVFSFSVLSFLCMYM